MVRSVIVAIAIVAFTDVSLQLDNAIAISSVASGVPSGQRPLVLVGGVLLAAACLFAFTIVGSTLVERFHWLKPVAGIVLVGIGGKMVFDYLHG